MESNLRNTNQNLKLSSEYFFVAQRYKVVITQTFHPYYTRGRDGSVLILF